MNNPVAWCLSYIFNKYLSGILREMSSEQIICSALKGNFQLADLEICSQDIPNTKIRLVRGFIKNFTLSIPWAKVLIGESCIIKLSISELFLEFTKCEKFHESNEDPQELKSEILEAFEAKIRDRRTSFKKVFDMLSTKLLNIEVIEFILSRLEVNISGIQVNFTHSTGKDLIFAVSAMKLLPTDSNFQKFPEETMSLWNRLQVFKSVTFTNPTVTLSESLLQFKIITFSNIEVSAKSKIIHKILNLKELSVVYSSKNFLWLGESRKNTDIQLKSSISEVVLNMNNEIIETLVQVLELKGKRIARTAKELWGIAREAIFHKVRMRSWWFLTKKILWKSVYQKLYAKYIIGVEPEQTKPDEILEKNLNAKSGPFDDLHKYIQMRMPEVDFTTESKRPISNIVPTFHFSYKCPVKKLEQALMADLEKNLELHEILEYRIEEQERYDYMEFEKAMLNSNNSRNGLSQIYNYFKAKGGIPIKQTENNKKVDLSIEVTLENMNLNLISKSRIYLTMGIYQISIQEHCVFNQPIFRKKHVSYDRNSLAVFVVKKVEVHDLFVKESKIVKPIMNFLGEITIKVTDKLKHEYLKGSFKEVITKTITVTLPHIIIFVVPELALNLKDYILSFFPSKSLAHLKEDHLLDLLEDFQRVHLNSEHLSASVLHLNIFKLELYMAESYAPDASVIKAQLGGINLQHSATKSKIEFAYIDLITSNMYYFFNVSNLFLPKFLTSRLIKIDYETEKSEIFFKIIQMEISQNDIFCIFKVLQKLTSGFASGLIPKQIITIPIKEKQAQKILSTLMIHVNAIFAVVHIDEQVVKVIVKNIFYCRLEYLLEIIGCASAREVNVVNEWNQQVLFHMHSDPPPSSFLLGPGTNSLKRDALAAFYLIHQSVEKISCKYSNILSKIEFTFANLNITIDLKMIAFILALQNSLISTAKTAPITENVIVILSKLVLHGTNLSILFLHQKTPFYMLLSPKIYLVLDNYSNKSQLRLRLIEPTFIDLSMETLYHSQILSSLNEFSKLELNYISHSKNGNSTVEIKVSQIKLTFLNRVILEIYDFFYYELLGVFSQDPSQKKSGKMALCLLVVESKLFLPRNSVTHDGFTININSVKITNEVPCCLSDTLAFKAEKELEERLAKQFNFQSLPKSQLELKLTAMSFVSFADAQEWKNIWGVDINPQHIKVSQNIVEVDGFEINYYDPDEIKISAQPEKKNKGANLSESINDEDDFENELTSNLRVDSVEFDSLTRKKSLRSFTPPGYKSYSSESDTKSRVQQNIYTILLDGCHLFDYFENKITNSDFGLSITINNADKPLNILIQSISENFDLTLYQDQYYIIIKTLQENFFELTRNTEMIQSKSEEIWLSLNVDIKNFAITIVNCKLQKLLRNGLRKSKIFLDSNLCKIFCEYLKINVDMSENRKKMIKISASDFQISDNRKGGDFNGDHNPPLFYLFSNEVLGNIAQSPNMSFIDDFTPKSNIIQNLPKLMGDIEPILEISLLIQGMKNIKILFSNAILIFLPDFLSDLRFFFQSPFNEELFSDPDNVKFIPDPDPPDMTVEIFFMQSNIMFPSSYLSLNSPCLLLRSMNLTLEVIWKGDCYLGPGTMEVKVVIDFEGGHLVPLSFGLDFSESKYYDSFIESYSLKFDYLYSKPSRSEDILTSQVNVRSSKDKDFNLNLTFSGIRTVRKILENFSGTSAPPNFFKTDSPLKIEVVGENPLPNNQISMNLALYGASVKLLNDQMQPVFLTNISELLCAYQQSPFIKESEASFIFLIEIEYFNQKLMAWEPMLEMWGLELQYTSSEGISMIDISEYSNSLQINISTALLATLSNILPVITNWAENTETKRAAIEYYRFQNDTGLPIKIYVKQGESTESIEREIEDQTYEDLSLEEINSVAENFRNSKKAYGKKSLGIEINPSEFNLRNEYFSHLRFLPVDNIGIDTPDTYFIHLEKVGEHDYKKFNSKKSMKEKKKNRFDRISQKFISQEEYDKHIEKYGEESNCCAFLRPVKKYQRRLVKEKVKGNFEKDFHNKVSLLVDVQWNQEAGQRFVAIRSSISVVNMLPNDLTITFTTNDSSGNSERKVLLNANSQISVPLLVASKGKLNIRPSDSFEDSKIITQVHSEIFTSDCLFISGTEGIVNKEMLSVVEFQNIGDIELGFIALCCTSKTKQNFYCALTVKKIVNANPVRRVEQVKSQINSQGKGLIGYKKKIVKQHIPDVKCEINQEEDFNLESTSDETMLVFSSIVSFTNALSRPCELKVWTDEDDLKDISTLSQGMTEHLYFLNIFKDKIFISISIAGYQFSNPIGIHLLCLEKEQKFCVKLQKEKVGGNEKVEEEKIKEKSKGKESPSEKKSSNLYLWIRVIEDENNCWRFSLYSPYWIINKSDLVLKYGEPRTMRKKKISEQEEESFSKIQELANIKSESMIEIESKSNQTNFSSVLSPRLLMGKTASRKYTDIFNNYKTMKTDNKIDPSDWNKIALFSTSKNISKLNVAVCKDDKISKWSQNFSLTNSGTSGELQIEGNDGQRIGLGVTIEKGQGPFQLTNVIIFRSLYILKNNYNRALSVKQIEDDGPRKVFDLPPNSETPIHWYPSKYPKSLHVAVNLGEGQEISKKWSGGFSVSELGEFIIKLPIDHIDSQMEENFLQVSVISSDPMIIIQFASSNKRVPYKLENYTSLEIKYCQVLNRKHEDQEKSILKPGTLESPTTENYAWDEEISPHLLQVSFGTAVKEIKFDEIARYSGIKIGEDIVKETLSKNKKHERRIHLKLKKWTNSKLLVVTLSEKWLIIEGKKKPISLDQSCTKVIYINDESFELNTCTKSILFLGNKDETLAWYEILDDTVRNSEVSTQLYVKVSVELIGTTHVMKFKNEDSSKSEKHHQKCEKARIQGEAIQDNETIPSLFSFNLSIAEIGISIIDQTPQEKFYLYLHNLEIRFQKFLNKSIGLHISVIDLKIDNQQAISNIPVILSPYLNSKTSMEQDQTVIFDIILERLPELDNINWMRFIIAPLEIKIDEAIISNLIEYVTHIQKLFQTNGENIEVLAVENPKSNVKDKLQCFSTDINAYFMLKLAEEGLHSYRNKDLTIEKRIYIHKLLLGPLELCVTLDKNNVDPSRSKKTNFIKILADLGLALTSIESTELKFAGFKLSNLLQPRSQFINSLFNHYKSQGIRELYKIVGSVELLGNPFALINSLKAGVKEMFYDPAVALIETPNKFGESLLKGSVGLFRHTVHGLFKSVGTLTGGIGRFLTAITLDKKFQTKMRIFKAQRANNFGDKLKIGFKQVGYGFFKGITGLVTSPIEGIKTGGFPGLLKGIGKGIIGTVAKPTAGIVRTVSDAFSGIGNFAKKKNKVRYTDRFRYPRSFNSDRILKSYDEISSIAQFALTQYKEIVIFEKILVYMEIILSKRARLLVITNVSIYILKKSDYNGLEIQKKSITEDPKCDEHSITLKVNTSKQSQEGANLKKKLKNGKSLLKELKVQYDLDSKEMNLGIFKISLRGIVLNQRKEDISQTLDTYYKRSP